MPRVVGKRRSQSGTVHAGQRAQHHLRRCHRRARVARADEAVRLAVTHQPQAHPHRRVALRPHRLRRLLVHADHFAGMHYFDRQPAPHRTRVQFRLDDVLFAHQQHVHAIVACSEYGAFNLGLGSPVSAHRVYGNCGGHALVVPVQWSSGETVYLPADCGSMRVEPTPPRRSLTLLFFFQFDDFAAFIVPALRARPMRQFALMTVRTLRQGHRG